MVSSVDVQGFCTLFGHASRLSSTSLLLCKYFARLSCTDIDVEVEMQNGYSTNRKDATSSSWPYY